MQKLILAQALGALFLASTQVVWAADVTGLTAFSAGTPAVAAQVNGNFNAVRTAVNDNHARITTLETTSSGGNIVLQDSTAVTGNLLKGTLPFLHNFGVTNTFIGVNAGNFSLTGNNLTALGVNALANNTTGFSNTASGAGALRANTTGFSNAAFGTGALQNNTSGVANIAIGLSAGSRLTTGNNNIIIGNLGLSSDTTTTRIGAAQNRAFIAGIRGVTTGAADAIPVVIDSSGQLGTISSSQRVKDHIADMGEASSVLRQLRPVTFYYKADQNPKGRSLQYGLVAEEVAKLAPGLVAHAANGDIETVFYQHLVPMLLNEYQKQQRLVETQTALLAKQTARLAELEQDRRQQSARIEMLEKQAARVAMVLGRLERAGMLTTAAR